MVGSASPRKVEAGRHAVVELLIEKKAIDNPWTANVSLDTVTVNH